MLRRHGHDAYVYALQLMDVLFSNDELSKSLLFKSKKSTKPAMPHDRVQKLLGEWSVCASMCASCTSKTSLVLLFKYAIDILDKKFSDGWDLKTLTQKANQKSRDTKVIVP